MSRSTTHDLQPQTDSAGMSRRLAVLACKRAVRSVLETQLRADYQQNVLPLMAEREGSPADIAPLLLPLASYQAWASANRAVQDRMWALLAGQVDADYERIHQASAHLAEGAAGTLKLAADDAMPPYLREFCIHGQPGGYALQRSEGDLAAGILYEAGGNIYALGQGIGKQDSKGERLIAHIRESRPDFKPGKILELGCAAGAQSTDYPQAFPYAEFHAVDASPGMLRYAHARAEALGVSVNFRQVDAACTGFADGSFDLIVSHNLFHEVAAEHMPGIMRECYRLLSPGGVCIHQDVPIQTGRFDAFGQFLSEWQKNHNDEPFWLDFANADLPSLLEAAGFAGEKISSCYLQALDGPIPWYVVTASKA